MKFVVRPLERHLGPGQHNGEPYPWQITQCGLCSEDPRFCL